MKRRIVFIFIIILFSLSLVSFSLKPTEAAGASLYFSPATGNYTVGNNFTVKAIVNSGGDMGINAAESNIIFDKDLLSVAGVAKTGSIFTLWTVEPTYSNSVGTISFGGGSPSAYKGAAGPIITITFSAKKAGLAKVNFTGALVLAADGQGTNIVSGTGSGNYTINEKTNKEKVDVTNPDENSATNKTETEKVKGIVPPPPEITSKTHPKEDVWYANNEPEFMWKLLSDISSMSYSLNNASDTNPKEEVAVVESKKYEKVDDGIWYFHAKFKNKSGWSQVAHRRVQIDKTAPTTFDLFVDNEGDVTNPTPLIKFTTEDKTSGLAYYKVKLDNEEKQVELNSVVEGTYRLAIMAPGEHTLAVSAFDNAGNSASSSKKFIVEALKSPIIKEIPTIMTTKEKLVIRGTSFYPRVTVQIYISEDGKDPESVKVKTDDEGNWAYFRAEKMEKGMYEIWARIIDNRGAQSYPTTKNILNVVSPSILQAYGLWIILILLIFVIVEEAIIMYMRYRFTEERKRIKRETVEAKETVVKVFNALKEELDEQMEYADKKKGLSESERRIKTRLSEAMDIAQEFIDKEITDAEKEIKLKEPKL